MGGHRRNLFSEFPRSGMSGVVPYREDSNAVRVDAVHNRERESFHGALADGGRHERVSIGEGGDPIE